MLEKRAFLLWTALKTSLFQANLIGREGLAQSRALERQPKWQQAAKPKAPKPVTLKDLAAQLAEDHQVSKRQGTEMLQNLVTMITKHLKKGERIRIAGLGILQVRKRAARMGRNPATGEAIKIKASKKVAFRAAKELKLAV